jgi:hypothetical protein
MAVAVVSEVPDGTLEMYAAVNERIGLGDRLAPGHLMHALARREEGGLQVIDVWESVADFERFDRETLAPVVREVTGGAIGPPRRRILELERLVRRPG